MYVTLSINDTQHNKALQLCLESHFIYCFAECRYSECRYAECRSTNLQELNFYTCQGVWLKPTHFLTKDEGKSQLIFLTRWRHMSQWNFINFYGICLISNNDLPYFIKYSAHFFTLKIMLKYFLGTMHGR
jgi:hypothetical protein